MSTFPKWIDDLHRVFHKAMKKREAAEKRYKLSPTEKNRVALNAAWKADDAARRAWTVPFDAYIKAENAAAARGAA